MRRILKIGLVCVRDGRVLFVRKKGAPSWILPGGKPEPGEDDATALAREVHEELGCGIGPDLRRLGEFTAPAADLGDLVVTVRLLLGSIEGSPVPGGEIEACAWIGVDDAQAPFAPSLAPHILPLLLDEGVLPALPGRP